MRISIVIPSKNRPGEIVVCLDAIMAQPTAPYEIIVVDQSSVPYALPVLPGVVHIYMPHLTGLTAARNTGADAATGEVILFLDDDAVMTGDVVAALDRRFAADASVAGGQCRIVNYERPPSLDSGFRIIFERGFFNAQPIRRKGEIELRSVHGAAMAFRTAIVQRERFDESLIGYCLGEDFEFSQRVKRHGRLVLFTDAPVRHEQSSVNRFNRRIIYRWRWRNFRQFFLASPHSRSIIGQLTFRWWQIGEIVRWLRFGFGDPRGVREDPSPHASTAVPRPDTLRQAR